MVETLQLLAIPLTILAAVVRRAEARVVECLRSAEAFTPGAAVELPRFHALGRWQLGRMEKAGALVSAQLDRVYFVEEGYAAFRKARRKRALVVVSVLVGIALFTLFALAPAEGTIAGVALRRPVPTAQDAPERSVGPLHGAGLRQGGPLGSVTDDCAEPVGIRCRARR